MDIIKIESHARIDAYQRPKRQAGRIPTDVLKAWDILVLWPTTQIRERLTA